jgi:RNA polymerase sigma factor (TIGR02999 family)
MDSDRGEVTRLLHAWAGGDRGVEERLFALVLPDLYRLARQMMGRERPDHTLEPTALINEAYFRLVGARERDWESRRHFFAIAARAMRRLLIDHAKGRAKGQKMPLEGLEEFLGGRGEQLQLAVELDDLLNRMEQLHPDWCPVVELKFYAGFTDAETADALGLPLRTMQRQFSDARRWLFEQLETKRCGTARNATKS